MIELLPSTWDETIVFRNLPISFDKVCAFKLAWYQTSSVFQSVSINTHDPLSVLFCPANFVGADKRNIFAGSSCFKLFWHVFSTIISVFAWIFHLNIRTLAASWSFWEAPSNHNSKSSKKSLKTEPQLADISEPPMAGTAFCLKTRNMIAHVQSAPREMRPKVFPMGL